MHHRAAELEALQRDGVAVAAHEAAAASIVQARSGRISTGSSDASWHQYSNSSPLAAIFGSSDRS